jgi:crotonobetainyl-CoA:carnitine CoA-transferase CaiB-like acyl-CoA transferase
VPEAALSDINVLDLGTDVAGPYCARMLGDFGANVIKVEPPEGEPARRSGPFPGDHPDPEQSGMFLYLNANKRGVTLDPSTPSGRNLLLELVTRADVLVENTTPGTLESMGIGWDDLQQVNPKLVMTSITPFGQTGPYRDYAPEEITFFAMSGRMYAHGVEGRPPLRYAPDTLWFQTGATAATATMAAIFSQRRYDLGQQIDVSAFEAMCGRVDTRIIPAAMMNDYNRRLAHPVSFASGVMPCADGFIFMVITTERFFRRMLMAIGRDDLLDDPRFATARGRAEHRDYLDAILMPWLLDRTRAEAFQQLQKYRVMCAPIQTAAEILADPQLKERGYFVDVDHPVAGRLPYPGAPFIMSETPFEIRCPAPLLGQHNEEVYCGELGLSKDELLSLHARGVV